MAGTRVQQTWSLSPVKAVEVVQNHEDGTGVDPGRVGPKGARKRFRE
jgi:hypothetical protein